jgi:hypothetical protein
MSDTSTGSVTTQITDTLQMPKTPAELEAQIASMKPRFFDTYLLPPFMLYFAFKAKSMPRLARRMLFGAGIYMAMRSYTEYKATLSGLKNDLAIITEVQNAENT